MQYDLQSSFGDNLQQYLSSLAENLPASVFLKDREGRYLYVNSAFVRSTDLTEAAEALGKRPSEILDPERAKKAEEEDRRVLEYGESIINRENFDRRVEGRNRWDLVSKVPVRSAEGRIMGMVGIVLDIHKRKLAEESVKNLAWELKEKNLQLEEDLDLARKIQTSLNAENTNLFADHELEIAFDVRQSQRLGGDFVKIARTWDGSCVAFVCDVMGHGVQAALVGSLLSGQIDRIASELSDPGTYLTQLNARFATLTQSFSDLVLVTALCMRFDPREGRCAFASAGHPLPLHFSAKMNSMSALQLHEEQGQSALGLLEDHVYKTDTFVAEEGDLVVLHSDGIDERVTDEGKELGVEWIDQQIEQLASSSAESIVEQVLKLCIDAAEAPLQDDVTLLVIKVPAGRTSSAGA